MTLDLARATIGPALQNMHDEWRKEAGELRRETAEWVARANASREHMEQVVERQHDLAQEVYNTHARLLQDMAAFQKERIDAKLWQEQVSQSLTRLSELHRELSVESTRIAGVVRDIISELARYQSDMEKRQDLFAEKVAGLLSDHAQSMSEQLQSATTATEEAMEALSKTNEETRSLLARDINALRREVQEVATRISRDITENRLAAQQNSEQHFSTVEKHTRSTGNKVLGWLLFGELLIAGGLGYLIMQVVK